MTPVVKLQDIVNEMDTLSDELHAYLNKRTGELVTISSEELQAAEEEDTIESYPEWQREVQAHFDGLSMQSIATTPLRIGIVTDKRHWKKLR